MIKVNGKEIKVTIFPNGEELIDTESLNYKETDSEVEIEMIFEDNRDLIRLMFIKKYIDEKGIKTNLLMRYTPYSRMDRSKDDSMFTLKYFTEFINGLNFNNVTIYEPHSYVTNRLLDNSRLTVVDTTAILVNRMLKEMNFNEEEDYVLIPDAGAYSRYIEKSKFGDGDFIYEEEKIKWKNIIRAEKTRDFKTGNITGLHLVNENLPKGPFRVIIADDICSGGYTFKLASNLLKELGAESIYLVVTHCENTALERGLLDEDSLIKELITTDSILTKTHNKIRVVQI